MHHLNGRFGRFQSWMKPTHCTIFFFYFFVCLFEFSGYSSFFKSEKWLRYCHFFLWDDQFFLSNQVVFMYSVVYRINPWPARPKASFKLFYYSFKFYWFLLFGTGGSWNEKNTEGLKVLLDVFVSQGFCFLQHLNEELLWTHHHSLQARGIL